jgi:hypothetical protein
MNGNPEEIVSELLSGAIGALDIPAELQAAAEATYSDVGDWLKANLPEKGDWHVYPQGSMRLGTVVRPTPDDEYDIDAVTTLRVSKDMIGKQELKDTVGDALQRYVTATRAIDGAPNGSKEGGRCWTLLYELFHLDVLPAIPNEDSKPNGIWITDRDLFRWQPSNPIAFADWFYEQMGDRFLEERAILAKRAQVDVDDLPAWHVRTTLQRVVQVLKVHRNAYFADELDERPPSIIVTTLAARAFSGDKPLFEAVMDVAANMPSYVERDSGLVVVCNPVQPDENFADRWGADPARVKKFYAWIDDLQATLDEAQGARGGLSDVAARLEKRFGNDAIKKSVLGFGARRTEDRAAGRLTVATTGMLGAAAAATRVRDHTFHGE